MARARPLITTAHGSHQTAFGLTEWGLLAFIAVVWGSSFLLIAVGVDHLAPAVVTAGRILFGLLGLVVVPTARVPVDREDWPRLVLLGVVWMAIPLSLFPIAEQWVDSSVAGMINGSVPLFAAGIGALLLGVLPPRGVLVGLGVGFVGVVAISLPSLSGAEASPAGVGLLVLAVALYGLSANLAVPLQQRYGGLPVLLRMQAVAFVLTAPVAVMGLGSSTFTASSVVAVVVLGFLGTGWAYVAQTTLLGRAGAARGSVPVYVTPVVAIALGATFRDERVASLALVGTGLVLAGAWITGRAAPGRSRR